MSKKMKVMIEIGPRGKKVVAVAPEWPGLERAGKDEESAIEKLLPYLPRYARVAARAGLENEFNAQIPWQVTERYPGNGSTDFWGISFIPAPSEQNLPSAAEWERHLKLLQAAWAEFDEIGGRVSAELKRGPRGGGRMRDHIIRHTRLSEEDMCAKVGVLFKLEELDTTEGRAAYRNRFVDALRQYHRAGTVKIGRTWTLPYLLRHTAYHVLDHTWEMEDKDLTSIEA